MILLHLNLKEIYFTKANLENKKKFVVSFIFCMTAYLCMYIHYVDYLLKAAIAEAQHPGSFCNARNLGFFYFFF